MGVQHDLNLATEDGLIAVEVAVRVMDRPADRASDAEAQAAEEEEEDRGDWVDPDEVAKAEAERAAARVAGSGGAGGSSRPQVKRRIALEFFGRYAYLSNDPGRMHGRSQARIDLLKARGWEVGVIPLTEWAAQETPLSRAQYLAGPSLGLSPLGSPRGTSPRPCWGVPGFC